jgi:hypothetical protein
MPPSEKPTRWAIVQQLLAKRYAKQKAPILDLIREVISE